jgi:hypothetical protein
MVSAAAMAAFPSLAVVYDWYGPRLWGLILSTLDDDQHKARQTALLVFLVVAAAIISSSNAIASAKTTTTRTAMAQKCSS